MFPHTLSVAKLEDLTGGRRGYGTATGAFRCFIEPIDAETLASAGLSIGSVPISIEKTSIAYIDGPHTIVTSDKVTDQDSNVYTVKGAKSFTGTGLNHSEVILEAV